jgi:hypothetical protein
VQDVFGHREKQPPPRGQELEVDAMLEQNIMSVKVAVDTYLDSPGKDSRTELLTALNRLDDQIARGERFVGPANVGLLPTSYAVGATSINSAAQEIPSAEFRAQIALVRAAKSAATGPTPETLAGLRRARAILDSFAAMDHRAPPEERPR